MMGPAERTPGRSGTDNGTEFQRGEHILPHRPSSRCLRMRGCGHNHFELAQRTDMTGPAVYRLVSELVEHGWLQRTSARRVRFGTRLWELTSSTARFAAIRRAALPALSQLHRVVGQDTMLAVPDGQRAIAVEHLAPPGTDIRVTGRLALFLDLAAMSIENLEKIAGREFSATADMTQAVRDCPEIGWLHADPDARRLNRHPLPVALSVCGVNAWLRTGDRQPYRGLWRPACRQQM